MGFIDIFLKPEEGTQKKVNTQSTNSVSQPQQQPVIDNSSFVQAPQQTQQVNQQSGGDLSKMVASLWQSIIDRNLPGPDYLELRNSISTSKIASLPISEQQKVETAFSMLSMTSPSFTKDVLLQSIDQYISILEQEKNAGLAECSQQRKMQIEGKKNEIINLNKELSNIESEIQKLSQQKEAISKAIQMKSSEIQASEASITKQENDFVSAVNTVQKTLVEDKAKYQTYNL